MRVSRQVILGAILSLATIGCSAQADPTYRPTVADCLDAVPSSGLERFNLAAKVALSCSKYTRWVPSFPERCCESLQGLVGQGGDLAYCLCDATSAQFASAEIDELGVNTEYLAAMCEDKFDIVLPYKDSSTCPPPQPAPTPAPRVADGPVVQFPSQDVCKSRAEDLGQSALINLLAPCLIEASDACCTAGESLIGPGGGMEYCLCNPDSAGFIIDQALQFGVDVLALMQSCTDQGYQVPQNYNSFCYDK